MKERLTKHESENVISVNGKVFYDYPIADVVERLAELEDKIEDGTLIEPPCKKGTIVYTIRKEDWAAEYTIVASRVTGFSDYGDGLGLRFILPFGSPAVSLVGDRVFFAHPEAEKKLKELKGEKG